MSILIDVRSVYGSCEKCAVCEKDIDPNEVALNMWAYPENTGTSFVCKKCIEGVVVRITEMEKSAVEVFYSKLKKG